MNRNNRATKLNASCYSQYRQTEEAWLEAIPAHWSIRPVWTMYRRVKRVGHPDEELLSVYRDHGVIPKGSRDDNFNRPSDDLSSYQLVKPRDLVLNKMKTWQGSIAISSHRGLVSPAYFVYEPLHDLEDRYLHHLLRSSNYVAGYFQRSKGVRVNQWDLDPDAFSKMGLLLPPDQEQLIIADFLDRETARIDDLIAQKERLIELLEEKRTALITRAVTKGLDPDVEMKDSDSPFLSSIPKGWQRTRLRYICRDIADGPHFSPSYVDDGIPFLSARNIKVNRWQLDDVKFITRADYMEFCRRVKPERGDVLYTKGGTTGIARAVDLDFPFQVWVHVAVLKLRPRLVDPLFLAYALNAAPSYQQAQLYTRGATNNDFGLTRMSEVVLLLPPLEQQKKIVAYLGTATEVLDETVGQIATGANLLREYRSALISAAVTGKIDVREAASHD